MRTRIVVKVNPYRNVVYWGFGVSVVTYSSPA